MRSTRGWEKQERNTISPVRNRGSEPGSNHSSCGGCNTCHQMTGIQSLTSSLTLDGVGDGIQGQNLHRSCASSFFQRNLGNAQMQHIAIGRKNSGQNIVPIVQRKCDKSHTDCDDEEEDLMGIQTKLIVGRADDIYEREADRIAGMIMRMPEPKAQQGDKKNDLLKARVMGYRPVIGKEASDKEVSPTVHEVLHSSGQPLDFATRNFMESRFGRDFSQIRIHADPKAAESARAVNAQAYTTGQDIVFGTGHYAPVTNDGQQLIAHELVHVLQQRTGVLQRTPDQTTLQTFDQRASVVRAHPAYLAPANRSIADDIIRMARIRDNCLYYIDWLTLLFDTPDAPRTQVSAQTVQESAEAAASERAYLTTPEGTRLAGVQETVSADPSRRWTRPRLRGEGGKYFDVDRSDPNNIVIRARVHLMRRGGRTTSQDVANIRSLEDAIERHASTSGYTVDIEFVDVDGRDVFTVDVDTSGWTTSGNWVGEPSGLAHELHHLLGLDDRYNYIESHAKNASMVMGDRLYWFREQMRKPDDPGGTQSFMGYGTTPLDDDICRAAQLDLTTCMQTRSDRAQDIQNVRLSAFTRCFRAFQILSGIVPPSPFDRPGQPTANDLAQREARMFALRIFGQPVELSQLSEQVSSMKNQLLPNLNIMVAPDADSECASKPSYIGGMQPPRVRLCLGYFQLNQEEQTRRMVRMAAQIAQTNVHDTASCSSYDCQSQCGGVNNADAWSHFVKCVGG